MILKSARFTYNTFDRWCATNASLMVVSSKIRYNLVLTYLLSQTNLILINIIVIDSFSWKKKNQMNRINCKIIMERVYFLVSSLGTYVGAVAYLINNDDTTVTFLSWIFLLSMRYHWEIKLNINIMYPRLLVFKDRLAQSRFLHVATFINHIQPCHFVRLFFPDIEIRK